MNKQLKEFLNQSPLLNTLPGNLVPSEPPVDAAGFQRLQTLAEEGNLSAINNVGLCLMYGWHVAPDPAEGCAYFARAAQGGAAEAATNWGLALLEGRGVRRDVLAALACFQRAAQAGERMAKLHMAHILMRGQDDIAAQPARAVELLRELAEQNLPEAEHLLGLCHLEGIGVPENAGQAFPWLLRAAQRDFSPSCLLLEALIAHRSEERGDEESSK